MFFIRNRSLQVADQTSNVKDKTRITELECTVKLSRFISIKKALQFDSNLPSTCFCTAHRLSKINSKIFFELRNELWHVNIVLKFVRSRFKVTY